MKRNIIYDTYIMAHSLLGCIAILLVYGILGIPMLIITQRAGYPEIIASLLWFGGGIIGGIHVGKIGRGIQAEKERFKKWRDIAVCQEELWEKREEAAWKMLRSKDLHPYALKDLFDNFQSNEKMINHILDTYSKLKLQKPVPHEQGN